MRLPTDIHCCHDDNMKYVVVWIGGNSQEFETIDLGLILNPNHPPNPHRSPTSDMAWYCLRHDWLATTREHKTCTMMV